MCMVTSDQGEAELSGNLFSVVEIRGSQGVWQEFSKNLGNLLYFIRTEAVLFVVSD